jgi:FAD/FMN-containing dehydrogenase
VGAGLSAFEIMHRMGLDFLREVGPEVRHPFDDPPDWMCLIDLGMGTGEDPAGALETLFAEGFEEGFVTDGLVAQSEAQRAEFWTLRETIPLANRRIGAISSHDISVPVAAIPGFIAKAPGGWRRSGTTGSTASGIVGDGNLHYNVFPMPGRSAADHDAERPAIKACVHDLVHELGGSVSRRARDRAAEGGRPRALRRPGEAAPAAMRAIKAALDPIGDHEPRPRRYGFCGGDAPARVPPAPPVGARRIIWRGAAVKAA